MRVDVLKTMGRGKPDKLSLDIVREFRDAVQSARPDLRFRLTLFGSRARGEADNESDVDILVELDSEKIERRTRDLLSEVATQLSLRHGIVVSLVVLDLERARAREGFPFLEAIREQGIVA